jgi:hypothetical protein
VSSLIAESKKQLRKNRICLSEACPFPEPDNNRDAINAIQAWMINAKRLHISCSASQPDLFRDANAILFPFTQLFPFSNFLSLSAQYRAGKKYKN